MGRIDGDRAPGPEEVAGWCRIFGSVRRTLACLSRRTCVADDVRGWLPTDSGFVVLRLFVKQLVFPHFYSQGKTREPHDDTALGKPLFDVKLAVFFTFLYFFYKQFGEFEDI